MFQYSNVYPFNDHRLGNSLCTRVLCHVDETYQCLEHAATDLIYKSIRSRYCLPLGQMYNELAKTGIQPKKRWTLIYWLPLMFYMATYARRPRLVHRTGFGVWWYSGCWAKSTQFFSSSIVGGSNWRPLENKNSFILIPGPSLARV